MVVLTHKKRKEISEPGQSGPVAHQVIQGRAIVQRGRSHFQSPTCST